MCDFWGHLQRFNSFAQAVCTACMTRSEFVLPQTVYDRLTAVELTAAIFDTVPGSITEGHMLDASRKHKVPCICMVLSDLIDSFNSGGLDVWS